MADATTTNTAPKTRTRKTAVKKEAPTARKATAKAKTAAPKKTPTRGRKAAATAAATSGSFTESIELARAAVNSATTAAKARAKSAGDTAKAKVQSAKDGASAFDWKAQRDQVMSQATKSAKEAAGAAKVKTGSAMQGLAKLINDTADTVDGKLGPQYGDYARQAASAVANAAKSLDEKDVDQLLGEARDFVRKSPAVAIGAAAIAGYVLMRLARGSDES